VPRCGVLDLLEKPLHYKGFNRVYAQLLCMWTLAQLLSASTFWLTRYLIVVPRPLVVRRS
jgi:hypothetical protein